MKNLNTKPSGKSAKKTAPLESEFEEVTELIRARAGESTIIG